jgi:hypothetical protein
MNDINVSDVDRKDLSEQDFKIIGEINITNNVLKDSSIYSSVD